MKKQIFHHYGPIILWISVLTVLIFVGFWSVFNSYLWYDDEGYIMITLKGILEGNALYTQVYTQYGPFFFQFHEALYRLLPIDLTHDTNRILALIGWLLSSGIAAAIMFQIHRSQFVALTVFVAVFFYLEVSVKEPGHPQQFCLLLGLLGLWIFSRFRSVAAAFLIGALVAMVGLTKVNLGAFLALATLAATVSILRGRIRVILGTALLLAYLFFTKVVLSGAFNAGSISLLLTSLLSAVAIFYTVRERIEVPGKVLWAFVAGGFLTTVLSVGFSLLGGSKLEDLVWSAVTQHSTLMSSSVIGFSWIGSAIAAVGLAFAVNLRKFPAEKALPYLVFAGYIYGFAVLALVIGGYFMDAPLRLSTGTSVRGNADLIWWIAPGFAWLYCASARSGQQLTRIALAMISVILILGAFPVPGSQLAFSTVPLLMLAIGCLRDACINQTLVRPGQSSVFSHGLFRLAAGLLIVVAGFQAYNAYDRYHEQSIDPELSGATWLRLPQNNARQLSSLVENIHDECSAFVSINGVNSLYFWAGQTPPTWWNQTLWPFYLTVDMQQDIISRLDEEPEPCVIVDTRYPYLNTAHIKKPRGLFGRYVHDKYEESWRTGHFIGYKKIDPQRG